MVGMYVVLKHWARKDFNRPYGARNLYRVCRETEKAVLCCPVDFFYKQEPETFWSPKSAITEVIDTSMHFE